MEDDIYKVALAFSSDAKAMISTLIEEEISPDDFFTLPPAELIDNKSFNYGGRVFIDENARFEALRKARTELEFMHRHGIRVVSYADDEYPPALAAASNPPAALFVLGNASLTQPKALSVVGTRRCTVYGTDFCSSFIRQLAEEVPDACIVSGLAYGIDACAHTAALDNGLTTIAVMAHGLDMIYPAQHRDLAKRILMAGGAIVSEYPSKVKPYRNYFLARNRIVAWISDGVLVAESEIKGGAMSTANFAFNENREVMALPGRATDKASSGCNVLIRRNKATLVTSKEEIMDTLHWERKEEKLLGVKMPSLFPTLEGEPLHVFNALQAAAAPMQLDAIHQLTLIPVSRLLGILGDLEFDGLIHRLPGNRFESI